MKHQTDQELEVLEAEVDRELQRPAWLSERVQSISDLNNKDIPELAWIVPDLLTEGITVLAGMLKSGKSILVLNIALALAEGLPVLGQTEAERGRVLYISLDDKQESRLRARIRGLRDGRTDDIPFDIATSWPNLTDGGTEQIGEYLDYYTDTKLVVIDVLMNVLPDIREGADAYSEIYQKLEPLKALSQKHHVAVVLIMHMNKGTNGSNPRSRIYGSMAYGAIADNILLLDEDYQTHQRTLLTSGKDLEQDAHNLDYDKTTGRYTYGEKRIAELKEKTSSQDIASMVRAKQGITRKEIIGKLVKLGVGEMAADQRVTRAKKSGEICTVSGRTGFYTCDNLPAIADEYDDLD